MEAILLKQTWHELWAKSSKCSGGAQRSHFSLDIANVTYTGCTAPVQGHVPHVSATLINDTACEARLFSAKISDSFLRMSTEDVNPRNVRYICRNHLNCTFNTLSQIQNPVMYVLYKDVKLTSDWLFPVCCVPSAASPINFFNRLQMLSWLIFLIGCSA